MGILVKGFLVLDVDNSRIGFFVKFIFIFVLVGNFLLFVMSVGCLMISCKFDCSWEVIKFG